MLRFSLYFSIYQETLCYIRYIYKVEKNKIKYHTKYVAVLFISFVLGIFSLYYAHFTFYNELNTIIGTNTDLHNVQVHAQYWYYIAPVVW